MMTEGWVVRGNQWIRVTQVKLVGPGSATSAEVLAFTPARDFFLSEIAALYEIARRMRVNPLVPKPGEPKAMQAIRKRINEIEGAFRATQQADRT